MQGAGPLAKRAGPPAQGAEPPAQGAGPPAQGAGLLAQGAGLPAQGAGPPAQGAEPPAQGAGPLEPDQGVGPPATSIPQLDGVDDPEPTERDRARDLQTEQLDGGADPETEEERLLYMKNFEAFMDGFEERNSYLKTHEYNGNNLNELEYLIFYVIQKWDPDQGTST